MTRKRSIARLLLVGTIVVIVAGCATAPRMHTRYPGLAGPVLQEGLASWYGPGFHGRKTASGERFNQASMTCAHKTLPFGTKLKVTNLRNGEEIVVTVNDRGPYIRPRIIDLSREAAKRLGFIHQGTAPVRIQNYVETYAVDTQ